MWAALVEELIKFYAVKVIALNNPNFDEPVDAMIYMVTAALGFAAIENVLVMFRVVPDGASAAMGVWFLRFVGAVLLHALSSGILGYFLAMSWFFQQHRKKLLYIGLAMATIFHYAFNAFLSNLENQLIGLLFATSLLMIMAFLVSILFDKIKERRFKEDPYLI
jgi:RsiW-degrading membrane proteinase PrsW (M82 family)